MQSIRERKADFGASDVPLKAADLDTGGLRQFPSLLSAIVPVINLPSIPANEFRLDGATLADLMSGKIKTWNAPAIVKLNASLELTLPKLPVIVMYRAERSDSTAVFTAYLSSASPAWKSSIG